MNPDRRPKATSSDQSGKPPEAGKLRDMAMEDFHSFFEKLSSLDDLQWSSEPTDNPIKTKAKSAYRHASSVRTRPEKKEGAATSSKATPRVKVLRSENIAVDDSPSIELSDSSPQAMEGRGKITSADVTRFLKVALMSLILFGIGLGAGWAALSLPKRFEQPIPGISKSMNRDQAKTFGGRYRSLAGEGIRLIERIKPALGWGSGGKMEASASSKGNGVDAGIKTSGGEIAPKRDSSEIASKIRGAATSPDEGMNTSARGKYAMGSGEIPVPSETTAVKTNREPSYTLQVGACSSYTCVESFRKLLIGKVSSSSIKIIKQNNVSGGPLVQRIRIGPLGKEDAQKLKAVLLALDPQFKGAYVITTR